MKNSFFVFVSYYLILTALVMAVSYLLFGAVHGAPFLRAIFALLLTATRKEEMLIFLRRFEIMNRILDK